MQVPFLDLKRQFASIKHDVLPVVEKVIAEGNFTLGPELEQFEKNFAKYCGKKYCVGISSGADALELSLWSYGLNKGEVITVANTFVATVTPIWLRGMQPVLVDADPKTHTIDVDQVRKAITPKTKAIIPVDLFGQPADLSPLVELAAAKDLVVIEDACQAHGAKYAGKTVPIAETGCFSFYPGKNLGAFGDAGAIVTDNEEVAEQARMIRHHGQKEKYVHKVKGMTRRLDNLQAAILDIKLKHLDQWNELRRKHASIYTQELKSLVTIPTEAPYARHVYHLYVIETAKRDALEQHLKQQGISTGKHYPIPVHLQEAFQDLGYKQGAFPVSEQKAKTILSLPLFPEMTQEEQDHVIASIKAFFAK